MTNKIKKHTNEGHEAKVPMGRSIGIIFVVGMLVGGIVTFLAVAGRTQGVVQQRRELLKEKQAKSQEVVAPAETQTQF